MARIYLGLGSNLGDRISYMANAIKSLKQDIRSIRVSKVYETRPFGYERQDNFLNAAIEGETDLSPMDLLGSVKRAEIETGRQKRFRFGPREIDVDILFYGNLIIHEEGLDIPHQGMAERDFVLKPLMDLNPDILHPIYKKTVRQLYDELPKDKRFVLDSGQDLLDAR
jgi:2-amino-4-hydroxy-6-hydroxymethyldihydropteridine diphosphokinase